MMEKPKRPMSAYLLWLNSARSQIKADHPMLKVTEVAKKAGELWRAMEDKSTWEERAAAAKEQYTLDLEAFNATGVGAAPPAKRAQKRQGKTRQPKVKKERVKVKKEDTDEEGDDDEGDDDEAEDSE